MKSDASMKSEKVSNFGATLAADRWIMNLLAIGLAWCLMVEIVLYKTTGFKEI